jgi:hypothetical protein
VVAGESSASNNCSTGTGIIVNEVPNCTRSSISCGQVTTGELTVADCTSSPRGDGYLAEVLEFDVSSGTGLVIDASWQGLDGYLYLENPDGQVVAENDDGGSGSRIEYTAFESGVYSLWVTSFQRNAVGGFSVELVCGSPLAPDLVTSEVICDLSPISVGEPFAINFTLMNAGNAPADATQAYTMLSFDEVITLQDSILDVEDIGALGVGEHIDIEKEVSAPDEPGNYWIGACAEVVPGETISTNNCLICFSFAP